MKTRTRVIVLAVLAATLPASYSAAQAGGQLLAVGAAALNEDPATPADLSRSYQRVDARELFTGLEAELWVNRVGIGGRYIGRMQPTDDSAATADLANGYLYDWKSDLFFAYHFFRGGAFIDPYARFGVGVAMRATDGTEVTQAGLYQYLGAGGQINLGGLVAGAGVNYTILNQQLQPEDTDWTVYPISRFEVRLYGGIAFGR